MCPWDVKRRRPTDVSSPVRARAAQEASLTRKRMHKTLPMRRPAQARPPLAEEVLPPHVAGEDRTHTKGAAAAERAAA